MISSIEILGLDLLELLLLEAGTVGLFPEITLFPVEFGIWYWGRFCWGDADWTGLADAGALK